MEESDIKQLIEHCLIQKNGDIFLAKLSRAYFPEFFDAVDFPETLYCEEVLLKDTLKELHVYHRKWLMKYSDILAIKEKKIVVNRLVRLYKVLITFKNAKENHCFGLKTVADIEEEVNKIKPRTGLYYQLMFLGGLIRIPALLIKGSLATILDEFVTKAKKMVETNGSFRIARDLDAKMTYGEFAEQESLKYTDCNKKLGIEFAKEIKSTDQIVRSLQLENELRRRSEAATNRRLEKQEQNNCDLRQETTELRNKNSELEKKDKVKTEEIADLKKDNEIKTDKIAVLERDVVELKKQGESISSLMKWKEEMEMEKKKEQESQGKKNM